jgi:hypothetical protein
VPEPKKYTLEFGEYRVPFIKADCNQASGSCTAEDSQISIEFGSAAADGCSSVSLSIRFLQNLGFVRIFFFQDDYLFLDLMADGGTMEF